MASARNNAGLTPREKTFVDEFLRSGRVNGAASYKTCFPRANDSTARAEAARILARPRVRDYIAKIDAKANKELSKRVAIDREWVINKLVQIVDMAMAAVPVLDKDGNEIGVYQQNLPAANTATIHIGKELGMFVDRKETGKPGDFKRQAMTADEKRRAIVEKGAKLGLVIQLPKKS